MTALWGVGVSRKLECVTLADKEAMAPGQTKRDLLQTDRNGSELARSPRRFDVFKCSPYAACVAVCLALLTTIGCTQNLTATESSIGVGGTTGVTCSGQACSAAAPCCANYECNSGYCTAVNGAGPGQVCNEASGCLQLYGPAYPYTCEGVESTSVCLSESSVVKNGDRCEISADCSSLNCQDGVCSSGASTCRVSGSTCDAHANCCSNQCGPDHTCINDDPWCRVVGDSCNPTNPDCCSNNTCAKIGSTYRCVATYGCRGTHEVCGAVGCCPGVACVDYRCVELTSCTQRDYPCNDDSDCCSKKCAGASGAQFCVGLDGCQPYAEKCSNWWECCSSVCDMKKGRCGASATSCALEGEPCADRLCCLGNSGKTMACTPDSLGVKRCSDKTSCVEARKQCAFGSQCCEAARCDYDTSLDEFACTNYCRGIGEYCDRHSACCSNFCSPLGTCADVTQY